MEDLQMEPVAAEETKPKKTKKKLKPPKEKKPKAPKEKKEKKPKAKKKASKAKDTAKKQSKGHPGLAGLIVVLFLLVVFGMTAVCYLYNFLNFKTLVTNFFLSQDDTYVQRVAELEQYDADITERYNKLEEAALEIEAKQAELLSKETQLNSREEKLKAQEEQYKKDLTALNTGRMELDSIVETVSSMNAKVAAEMLMEFTSMGQIALILSNMEPKAVGKILKEMPAGVAASITELLMYLSGNTAPSYYQQPSYQQPTTPQTEEDPGYVYGIDDTQGEGEG